MEETTGEIEIEDPEMTTDQEGEVEIADVEEIAEEIEVEIEEMIGAEILHRLPHLLHEESHRALVREKETAAEEKIGEEGDQDLNPKKRRK
jgi:hypothetical protein